MHFSSSFGQIFWYMRKQKKLPGKLGWGAAMYIYGQPANGPSEFTAIVSEPPMDKCPASDAKIQKWGLVWELFFCFSHVLLVSDAARDILPYLWAAKNNTQNFARKDDYERWGSDGEDAQHREFNQQQTNTKYSSWHLAPSVSSSCFSPLCNS